MTMKHYIATFETYGYYNLKHSRCTYETPPMQHGYAIIATYNALVKHYDATYETYKVYLCNNA
jgi:hypothetical protein